MNGILDQLRKILYMEAQLIALADIRQQKINAISNLGIAVPPNAPTKPVAKSIEGSTVALCIFWPLGIFIFGLWGFLIGLLLLVAAFELLGNTGVFAAYAIISIATIMFQLFKVDSQNEKANEIYNKAVHAYRNELSAYNKRNSKEKHTKRFYLNQVSCIDAHSADIKRQLALAYGLSNLHPKYQHLVAVASIFDYLSTGRTFSLTRNGNDIGAYNIYEDDVRVNRIVAAQLHSASQIVNAVRQASETMRRDQQSLYNTVVVESKKIQKSLLEKMYSDEKAKK